MNRHRQGHLRKQLVLRLTSEQKELIQEHTGKVVETLNLADCGDRLTVGRACETLVAHEITGNQVLVLELTDEQKEELRRLTGKIFSQLRIHRRQS